MKKILFALGFLLIIGLDSCYIQASGGGHGHRHGHRHHHGAAVGVY